MIIGTKKVIYHFIRYLIEDTNTTLLNNQSSILNQYVLVPQEMNY